MVGQASGPHGWMASGSRGTAARLSFGVGHRPVADRLTRDAQLRIVTSRNPGRAKPGSGQARRLNRQLSLPVSTMSQWWVRRSRRAVVILASPNTLGHSPNAKFVVTITEVCS